jgi:hypothetical protein
MARALPEPTALMPSHTWYEFCVFIPHVHFTTFTHQGLFGFVFECPGPRSACFSVPLLVSSFAYNSSPFIARRRHDEPRHSFEHFPSFST